MASLRTWILAVACGSFAAGAVVGWIGSAHAHGSSSPPEEVAYAADVIERYGLDNSQQWRLRAVLQNAREKEIEILKSAQVSELPPEVMRRLLDLRGRTEQYVRAVLDDEQRARYDRDSRPQGSSAEPTKER